MSENVTLNVVGRRVVIALDGTPEQAIVGVALYSEQQYSNGVVRELLPSEVPNEDMAGLFSDADLQTIYVKAYTEMVLRGVAVPTLP